MKTNYINVLGVLTFLFLFSCGGSENDEEIVMPDDPKANLSISTSILTRTVITQFSSGDKMNLFVKTGSSINSDDYKTGISACYNGSTWVLSPTVELQNDAYVFASYPYSSSNDASQIPISVSPQIDYLYSGTGVKVSGNSPQATLTMKHALPMIAFNIAKGSYIGEGKLTKLTLTGNTLYKNGNMNTVDGSISGKDKGEYTISQTKVIEADGWQENFPQMFCLPFNSDGSNVNISLTVDGKEMKAALPKQDIAGGMKYLFRMMLTQNGILVLADQTEIISLNKDTDQMTGGTIGELSITYQGAKAVTPELTGSNKISGMVNWGDGMQESYSAFLSHSYNKEGNYLVQIQAIGATTVEFKDLECVEEIDFSKF